MRRSWASSPITRPRSIWKRPSTRWCASRGRCRESWSSTTARRRRPRRRSNKFPGVTLLRSEENSGPYRLIQEVISNTGYDAFLFQDADDWAATNRLEILLDLATRTGKELIGSQGHRLIVDEGEVVLYQHPLNPELTFQTTPKSKPVHHPTSLVTRDLIQRTGGFANALALLRRHRVPAARGHHRPDRQYCRVHLCLPHPVRFPDRLGGNRGAYRGPARSLGHPASARAMDRRARQCRSRSDPGADGGHLAGQSDPSLRTGAAGRRWPAVATRGRCRHRHAGARRRSQPAAARRTAQPPHPVFVIGAPRSGASILALAIAQLPSFKLSLDPTWLTNLSSSLHLAFTSVEESDTVNDLEIQRIDTEQFAAHFGAAAHDLLLRGIDPNRGRAIRRRTPAPAPHSRQADPHASRGRRRKAGAARIRSLSPLPAREVHPRAARSGRSRGRAPERPAHALPVPLRLYGRRARLRPWIEAVQAARDLEIALGARKGDAGRPLGTARRSGIRRYARC